MEKCETVKSFLYIHYAAVKSFNAGISRKQLTATVSFLNIKYT